MDTFHPVLGFDGEAYETLYAIIDRMRGYGVTLTLEDGSTVAAVLSKLVYDETTDRALTEFYRVVDGEYPIIERVPDDKLERAFATHIQVG